MKIWFLIPFFRPALASRVLPALEMQNLAARLIFYPLNWCVKRKARAPQKQVRRPSWFTKNSTVSCRGTGEQSQPKRSNNNGRKQEWVIEVSSIFMIFRFRCSRSPAPLKISNPAQSTPANLIWANASGFLFYSRGFASGRFIAWYNFYPENTLPWGVWLVPCSALVRHLQFFCSKAKKESLICLCRIPTEVI